MKQFKIIFTLATAILFIFSCTEPDDSPKKTVEATEITLDKSSLSLTPNGTETLTVTFTPSDTTDKEITWTSSDETVATVENGVVTGVAYGTTTITASTNNKKTATCTVEIKEINWSETTDWTSIGIYKTNFWDNASVYFVITDRFYNGNTGNDKAYGREKASSKNSAGDCGKFYGGDIAGLTKKLDYLKDLGINAIWITAPYEQIHGWCVGGKDEFMHYPYHGYYAMDYTNMDASMGTKDEFKTFVDMAHEKGIRIVMDVVMNHPGYSTIEDAKHLYPGVLKDTFNDAVTITIKNYHDFIDYESHGWTKWWTGDWIRARLGDNDGYETETGNEKGSCGGELPDFKTELPNSVSLPPFLVKKHTLEMATLYPTIGYNVIPLEERTDFTVRKYLIYWLSSWVKEFGIDGFRCDTAKHVEKEAWYQLKIACTQALRNWKAANSDKKIDDSDFWMTGEHWDHGVTKDGYYTKGGFDSMINFKFRSAAGSALTDISKIDATYADYAQKINSDSAFNVLSYISSHDTGAQDKKGLFYSDYSSSSATKQMTAGSLLAMCPGAIQVYYGDEAGRKNSPFNLSGDNDQKNRSQMPWSKDDPLFSSEYSSGIYYGFNEKIHSHWSKVLNFRKKHVAIGAGKHKQMAKKPYAFARQRDDDKVIVILGLINGEITVDVSSIGTTKVKDFYSGAEVDVTDGKATFTVTDANNGTLLIEGVN